MVNLLPLFNSPEVLKSWLKMIVTKKVIINLDSSSVSGTNYIPVMVLKNCEPELSYILAELFNMCLKEYVFLDCW